MKSSNALKCISISWMIFFFWKSPQPSDNWVPQNQVSHFEAAICELAPKGPWDNFLIGWAIACIQNSPNRRANRRILGQAFRSWTAQWRIATWNDRRLFTPHRSCALLFLSLLSFCVHLLMFFLEVSQQFWKIFWGKLETIRLNASRLNA